MQIYLPANTLWCALHLCVPLIVFYYCIAKCERWGMTWSDAA